MVRDFDTMIPSSGGGGHPVDLVGSSGARFCCGTESGCPMSSDNLEQVVSEIVACRRGAVRPAPEQADPDRIRPMPALPGTRGGALAAPPGGRRPRGRGDAGVPAHVARDGSRPSIARAEVPPRRDLAPAIGYADRNVPSEPAQHANRPSHAIDVGSSLRIRADGPFDGPYSITAHTLGN